GDDDRPGAGQVFEPEQALLRVNRQQDVVNEVAYEPVEDWDEHQAAPANSRTRVTTSSRVRSLVSMTWASAAAVRGETWRPGSMSSRCWSSARISSRERPRPFSRSSS